MAAGADVTLGADELLPRVDVVAQAGRELEIVLQVLQRDGTPAEVGQVLGARAQVRPAVESAEVVAVFSTEEDPPNIVIDVDTLTITATPEETSGWQANWPTLVAWWDVEITDAGGVPHQVTRPGLFTLNPEVTR